MGGREVREGILGDQGNRSGKQTDEEEREGGRSGFLWQMGCETIRGGASRGGPDRRGRGGDGAAKSHNGLLSAFICQEVKSNTLARSDFTRNWTRPPRTARGIARRSLFLPCDDRRG